jgi:hypothetical protein
METLARGYKSVLKVKYEYVVNGTRFPGYEDAPSPNVFDDMALAKLRAQSFAKGSSIKVLYDPAAPERSALSVSPRDQTGTAIAGGIGLWCAMFGSFLLLRRMLRGRVPPPPEALRRR